MLDKVRAAAACAWADLLGGDHRWCVRGALAWVLSLVGQPALGFAKITKNGVPLRVVVGWGG